MPTSLAILPPPEIDALIPILGAEVLGVRLPDDDRHDAPPLTSVERPGYLTRASEVRDLLLARALGADAACVPEHIGRTWATSSRCWPRLGLHATTPRARRDTTGA